MYFNVCDIIIMNKTLIKPNFPRAIYPLYIIWYFCSFFIVYDLDLEIIRIAPKQKKKILYGQKAERL